MGCTPSAELRTTGSDGSHPSATTPPPPYSSRAGPSGSNNPKREPPSQCVSCFALSPYGPLEPLPSDNPKDWKEHLKNVAPGKNPSKLINPPPSFTRRPPPPLPYGTFPAVELIGKGETLDRGFPYIAPPCAMMPHPFVTHDVNEHDWRRFLHDIRIAGSLSPMNRVVSGLLPLVLGFGILLGVAATLGVDQFIRHKKKGPVSQLIDYWNALFFNPRCIHVVLSKGPVTQNASQGPPQPIDRNWRLIITYKPLS